jgi:hypothetical protein
MLQFMQITRHKNYNNCLHNFMMMLRFSVPSHSYVRECVQIVNVTQFHHIVMCVSVQIVNVTQFHHIIMCVSVQIVSVTQFHHIVMCVSVQIVNVTCRSFKVN